MYVIYCYFDYLLCLFWVCVDGSTCIRPQRIPRKPKFWKYCAIRRTGYIDAAERCSGAWWTHVWSSCAVATVWRAILCALLSHVPARSTLGTTSVAWLWIFPSAVGWGGNDGWWCKHARFIGCKTRLYFQNHVLGPVNLCWVSRSQDKGMKVPGIYAGSPGPKIRECKYYNMDQETLRFVCCSKV